MTSRSNTEWRDDLPGLPLNPPGPPVGAAADDVSMTTDHGNVSAVADSQTHRTGESGSESVVRLYWNAALAFTALTFHCIPFAAYDFIDDDGATFHSLFGLAPLGMILLLICMGALVVQFFRVCGAYARKRPSRHHRLLALTITCAIVYLRLLTSLLGWAIRV